jgi:hypothetical protein
VQKRALVDPAAVIGYFVNASAVLFLHSLASCAALVILVLETLLEDAYGVLGAHLISVCLMVSKCLPELQ